ncbi:hypothetical protein EV286_107388 [Rhizobium sp. BK251]|nr:hypothetical protein EV286_107388 [Rhizobium sp. BK251]
MAREAISIDTIHGDVANLAHLLDEIAGKVVGMNHPPEIRHELYRVGALLWIARDAAESLETQIEQNIGTLRAGERRQ